MDEVHSGHPAVGQLQAFSQGRLEDEAACDTIASHIEACALCRDKLETVSSDTLEALVRAADTACSENTEPDPPETLEHPRYEILGRLGAGGMGTVYKARHKMMDRLVALKVLNSRLTEQARAAGQAELVELSLVDVGLHDEDLAQLPPMSHLQKLVLDGNAIVGKGLWALDEEPRLAELSLACPTFTDDGARYLRRLKGLTRLSLAKTGVSDAGLVHLASLGKLEAVDLRGTKVTAAGIAELHKVLPKCEIQWDGAKHG